MKWYVIICEKCGIEKNDETTYLLKNSYCSKHSLDNLGIKCDDCYNPFYRYCTNHKYKKIYKFLCCFG